MVIDNKKKKSNKCNKFGHEAKDYYKNEEESEDEEDIEDKSHNSELNKNDFIKPTKNNDNTISYINLNEYKKFGTNRINALFPSLYNIKNLELSNDQIKLIDNIGITLEDIKII
ncbi:hypothetical protein C6P40_002323 [Pichia californica]|uniref:Uncharacterized protein n=1 Tax=Pichia californica TaxID=460514 RepID=A0A9P7BFH8_9ASCO|nr:hypothetical protein C6P40_002323 [[Candida] californica]